ncbi:MAG: sugar phosphate isomerase, partial [Gammaproteobacteria bacterium]
ESPRGSVHALSSAGIRIPKMQISAGLRFEAVDADTEALLRPFDDGVYLHQVVERSAGRVTRHADLADAFAAAASGPSDAEREWRVHFHVPIFLEDLGACGTTQAHIREVLALHRGEPVSDHLEVETYTWDVLPESFRSTDTATAVARELEWVIRQLA